MLERRLGAALLALAVGGPAVAADHAEAPGAAADPAADITDLYAWHDGGKIVAVLDFAGFGPAGGVATYDADVLYGIHVDDDDADFLADHDIWIRFGQDGAGGWGVQVLGLPGANATVEGAVETTIAAGNGLSVFAGLRDDPFFFDFTGLGTTLSTATVSFDSTRDTFAGTNVTSIVVEMDAAAATGTGTTARIWATTARK